MKVGYQGAYHVDDRLTTRTTSLTYRFNNAIPNRLTEYLSPLEYQVARSLQRGVRAGQLDPRPVDGAGRGPLRPLVELLPRAADRADALPGGCDRLPREHGRGRLQRHHPRVGAAYDLFGTGKTALKFNMGRYLEAAVNDNGAYSRLAPSNRLATSTNRTWTDANGNFIPIATCRTWRLRTAAPPAAIFAVPSISEVRQTDGGDERGFPGAPGLGRASGRLAGGRDGAAPAAAARLDRSR